MPKREGYIYDKMLSKEKCKSYILNAAKNKKKRRSVLKVLSNLDEYSERMYTMLRDGAFEPTMPNRRRIYDSASGKWREISSVPFWPDGCVHAAVAIELEPIIMRSMDANCFASVPNRGGAKARKYIRKAIRKDRKGTKYAAELDVRKCYPSVKIPLLMDTLRKRIKDERFLSLIEKILTKGLDEKHTGLEIGYRPSQWLMNFFLEPIDRLVRSANGVRYYMRYMDNMTLLGPNKRKLHKAVIAISEKLTDMGLALKGDWQVFPVKKRPVRAVGYRFHRNGAVTLRKTTALRLMKQSRRIKRKLHKKQKIPVKMAKSMLSRYGQAKYCSSRALAKKYVMPLIKKLKEVVRHESTKQYKPNIVYA